MPDIDKLVKEAEKEIARAKALNDERELKAGRLGLVRDPYHGLPDGSEKRQIKLEDADKRFLQYIRTGEQKALVLDDLGQVLVSPAIEAEISRAVAGIVIMRSLASQRTIEKDRILIRGIDEAEVKWGRLEIGTEVHEKSLVPATPPQYKYVESLNGLSKVGVEMLSDSDFDLANILVDSFARAVADAEEKAFVIGGGHDVEEPQGYATDAVLLADSVVETSAVGAITLEDVLEMVYTLPSKFRRNAVFQFNSLSILELRRLRAESTTGVHEGAFLWVNSPAAGQPSTLAGYPVYTQDNLETLAATEGIIGAFGDFSQYRILDHTSGMSVQRLVELYIESGLHGFILHKRVGGYIQRPQNRPIVLLKEAAA